MKYIALTILAVMLPAVTLAQNIEQTISQSEDLLHEFDQDIRLDTVHARVDIPNMIPMILPAEWFIPDSRLAGTTPWTGAPITRPVVYFFPQDGLPGLIGAGAFSQAHPDKFFSTLNGNNVIDVPQLYISEQKFLGNSLRLGKKSGFYFVSGIMYGAQLGVMGNNWGMGTKEGILWRPNDNLAILVWNQYFQSVSVYSPIAYPSADGAAVRMPATPEVFTFGVQASFVAGQFIIDIGASVSPVPYQKRKRSELRYK
jgi:hypothetical protein